MNDALLRQYLLDVKKLLPCSPSEKKRCILELEADVYAFLEAHPNATREDLYSAIGSPESIAKSFTTQIDPKELSHKLSAKRKISIGVIVVAAVLALVIGILYAVTTYMRHDFYDGYFVETFDSAPDGADPTPSALAKY